jgi:UrcA family protein
MKSKLASAAFTLAVCSGVPAAAAQPQRETVVTGEADASRALGNGFEEVSAVVRYGDLDLRSATGVAALNSRVYRAATRLCMQGGLQPVWMIAADRACRDDAIEGAQPQIAAAIASHASGNRLAAGTLSIRAAR